MLYQKLCWTLSAALLVQGCSYFPQQSQQEKSHSVVKYVDPFIGTDGKGKTYPGATVPYGMVQLSPDNGRNGWDWISGYFYPDSVISGFSHTHLSGTGAGDLYDISFMPFIGEGNYAKLDDINPSKTLHSKFNHNNELASPGYYQVTLDDYDINVELTAGLRTGVQKYTYAADSEMGKVKLDLNYARNWDKTVATQLTVFDDYSVGGYRKSTGWAADQRVYFYTVFSTPINDFKIKQDQAQANHVNSSFETLDGEGITATFEFDLANQPTLMIKTAISSVSVENAKQNLLSDGINKSFEEHKFEAEVKWHKVLSQIEIDASEDNKKQFYTALYHSYLAPRIFSDSNGQYKGPDGNTHLSLESPRYSFFSLWDTFRALHPWKTITDVEHSREMIKSIMAHYDEYGLLPVWNFQGNETNMMMGYHAVPVIVDAYLKGIISDDDVDGERLFEAVTKSAMQDEFGIKDYRELGYVPFEYGKWNVSKTLEYAFDDWSIAQLAQKLGKKDAFEYFSERALNYTNHFDPDTLFMRAKSRNGQFKEQFDPLAYRPEDYCEANAWQYNFFVPHDIENLIELTGGKRKFAEQLDKMFTTQQAEGKLPEWISGFIGQYVHGNEPAHHVPYLYQYAGQPHKTQQRIRQIMDTLYTTEPDGLAGNEDAGQMSAWYMFSALGFYPVNPVAGQYVLGSPEVKQAQFNLPNGKTFKVVANNQSEQNIYVRSVLLNGKKMDGFILNHSDIMAGGTLTFNMAAEY